MKQGNSESNQTPDFVFSKSSICARTTPRISYVFEKDPYFRGKKSDFREKKSDFRKKSEKKNRHFVFPTMFHNKTICLKIVNAHGAIISSSP